MTRCLRFVVLSCLVFPFPVVASAAAVTAADSAAIARVIDDSIGWFATKDFDRMFGAFADDADFFIFHPDSKSTIRGIDAMREHSRIFADPDFVYAGHEIRDLKIDFGPSADVAWYSALLEDCSSYKGEKGCWDDCRWTGVLAKRAGRWVIVQMHFSFAEDQVVAGAARAHAERDSLVFGSYPEMRGVVVDLHGQGRFAEAAAILAGAVPRYPDHVMANTFNLALMYAKLGDRQEAVRAFEDGHRRGVFYNTWSFEDAVWDTLRGEPGFAAVLARNDALIAEAQKGSVMKLEVVTPEGYRADRKYPLFIALHGGGENLEQFRPHWTSPGLRRNFIVAYVQSSQVISMNGYHWQDEAVTCREIAAAYREVLAGHAVDTSRVVIGGFSSGGFGSLVAFFAETVPASGFVVLCPEIPADATADALDAAVRRGARGTLLTTELDGRLERQKEYVARLNERGLDVRLVVTPDIGHWYPDNLEQLLDEALERVGAAP
ncbi:nuclear transport factor 2 family protein [bacterium]|nr:nuclear transport factor 2 family protein [bacterium]